MNNEILSTIIEFISDNLRDEFKKAGSDVIITPTEQGILISLNEDNLKLKDDISEFKNFVKEIPDFIYLDILQEFNDKSDITLNKLNDLLINCSKDSVKYMDLFKTCAAEVKGRYKIMLDEFVC